MQGRRSSIGRDRRAATRGLLSMQEITLMFGVNHRTVTRWVRLGSINAIRVSGGGTRFRADEVSALLECDRGDQAHP